MRRDFHENIKCKYTETLLCGKQGQRQTCVHNLKEDTIVYVREEQDKSEKRKIKNLP